MSKRTIVITGGAGFIGSHVVRLFVNKYPDYRIINLDCLTYAYVNACYCSGLRSHNRDLHLHGLQNDDTVARVHSLAYRSFYLYNLARYGSFYFNASCGCRRCRRRRCCRCRCCRGCRCRQTKRTIQQE